ncbi:MAG TPA: D-alanyl-D-alanine carboxypeptidase/D-alanyl-D-alanine-endopeptidase [Acidimicrobiia bacterium]|nr:D-alanyl-D-alanine carboxypeptidase/D-alanyl-D-alanine-endopeptidase [Acidimicrobiia bacterium]
MKDTRRSTTTAALAAVSLLCGFLALRPPSSGAAVETAARPVWTPERLPALLAEAQGTVDLERAVDELLGQSPARTCLAVYEGERPVLLRRPDQSLIPASTQKTLVATAALAALGPDFRYETRVVADSSPRDGAVGTLWLIGSGDPTLASPEYMTFLSDRPRFQLHQATPVAALADGLKAAGITAVTDAIVGDDSRYDRTRILPGWKASYVIDNEVGPLSALLVNGGFAVFEPPEKRADDPAAHAASELSRLATAAGIAVGGPARSGVAPPEGAITVATVRSAPLSDIVAGMLRESDNTAAELLVREIGVAKRRDGSTPAGTQAISDALTEAGLPTAGLRLGDGSGLEVTNQSSCALLAAALRKPDRGGAPELSPLLAVAGRSGTLSLRLVGTPLEGNLRAKTGSLNGVSGLTGYLDGRRGLSFAFLANGPISESAGRLLQDRLMALLAGYPGPQPRL